MGNYFMTLTALIWSNQQPVNNIRFLDNSFKPKSELPLDARPPGLQTAADSIHRFGNTLSWRLVMRSFLRPFSSYCLFKQNSCQLYWRKDVHYVLVNRLGLSLPRKSVDKFTGRLDMTIVVA